MVNHAANINQIRNRVQDRVRTRLTGSGANLLVQGNFPPGVTQWVTISIDGNGPPAGNAPCDLLNMQRNLTGFVRIGTGSLDLASIAGPVASTTTINERADWERVADAIPGSSRLLSKATEALALQTENPESPALRWCQTSLVDGSQDRLGRVHPHLAYYGDGMSLSPDALGKSEIAGEN